MESKTIRDTYHRDGTVTYWSVYCQEWIRRADPATIPDEEIAARSGRERERMAAIVTAARQSRQ